MSIMDKQHGQTLSLTFVHVDALATNDLIFRKSAKREQQIMERED